MTLISRSRRSAEISYNPNGMAKEPALRPCGTIGSGCTAAPGRLAEAPPEEAAASARRYAMFTRYLGNWMQDLLGYGLAIKGLALMEQVDPPKEIAVPPA